MWSIYVYCGFGFGIELYEGTIKTDDGEFPVNYFLVTIGFIRVQHAEYL
tara:strand:- start:315 stop:461 length:147 start_codon:yes stop_codon:yes gene_type:complete